MTEAGTRPGARDELPVEGSRPRVLCVDDEPELLDGLRLVLRRRFDVTTAASGAEALALLDAGPGGGHPPFDAVLADMRMPGMSGAELLTVVRHRLPAVPRLLLTGQADVDSAVAAVNDARVFRFLTKPCPPDVLAESLAEAVEHARLRHVERELLDRTLNGTVALLTDVLGLVSPVAHSRATRVTDLVREVCDGLGMAVPWDLNLAAMLCQVGFVVAPETAHGTDDLGSGAHQAALAADLLDRVPRLEAVSAIIAGQHAPAPRLTSPERDGWPPAELKAEILRACVRFDAVLSNGTRRPAAVTALGSGPGAPPRFLVEVFARLRPPGDALVEFAASARQLVPGMLLTADVLDVDGRKLAGTGMRLTSPLVERIQAFARTRGVREPIHVLTQQWWVPPPRRD